MGVLQLGGGGEGGGGKEEVEDSDVGGKKTGDSEAAGNEALANEHVAGKGAVGKGAVGKEHVAAVCTQSYLFAHVHHHLLPLAALAHVLLQRRQVRHPPRVVLLCLAPQLEFESKRLKQLIYSGASSVGY